VGNTYLGDCMRSGAETVGLNPLKEFDEEKGKTHGDSVGQEINMEKGQTNRPVLRLVSEKTGECAFGTLSICE